MGQKIERDHQRFRKLVRGKVKSNLSKYISRGEMIGQNLVAVGDHRSELQALERLSAVPDALMTENRGIARAHFEKKNYHSDDGQQHDHRRKREQELSSQLRIGEGRITQAQRKWPDRLHVRGGLRGSERGQGKYDGKKRRDQPRRYTGIGR